MAGRVLITGAAGGLGTAIAGALAERGAVLMLVDIDAARLLALRERLACHAHRRRRQRSPRTCSRSVAHCERVGHVPDVLVNNAGVEKASEYADLDPREIRHALEVNLLGAMLLTRELLPGMCARGRGHVVNIASMAAIKTVPFNAVYNTAKAGLAAFSLSLSKELEGTGVDATVLCPSAVTGRGDVGARQRSPGAQPARRVLGGDAGRRGRRGCWARSRDGRGASWWGRRWCAPVRCCPPSRPPSTALTDRLSRIRDVYRERISTDRDNLL